jgi:UDP-glucuronate decarboxylase
MRSDDGRVVSNVICQALAGEDITIYGDGSQTRSFCFVDDLVRGLMLLMDSDSADGMPVNLGNPTEMTVRELVSLVKEMTGSNSRIVKRPLPVDDPKRRKPIISRAKELLGWQPEVGLREGLEETIRWFDGERRSKRVPWRGVAPPEAEAPLIQAAE